MSLYDPDPAGWLGNGFASVRALAERWNIYPARAVLRMFTGLVPGVLLASSLIDIQDTVPGDGERMFDFAVATVSVVALLVVLRRFGQRAGRGIVWGLWLWVVSFIWWQGLVAAAYTAWLAAGMDGDPTDWAEVAFSAVLSAALFIPSNMGLKRLDPDD